MHPLALPLVLLAAQSPEGRPAWLRVSAESVDMPRSGERLGLLGVTLGFGEDGPYVAPALFGAVRGERGGLLALGFEGGWRARLSDTLGLQAGLFLGGGGGGGAPVGSGLMVRIHGGLDLEVTRDTRLGAVFSEVRWPGGEIRGRQAALTLERRFRTFHGTFVQELPETWERQVHGFQVQLQRYDQSGGLPMTTSGRRMDRSVGLAGVVWTRAAGTRTFFRAETAAAAQGDAAGYMEVLAGGGLRLPLGRHLEARAAVAAGSGGGGGLDTGGGFLLKGNLDLDLHLGRGFVASVGLGQLRAPSTDLRATVLALKAGFQGSFAAPGVTHTGRPLERQAWRLRPLWIHLTDSQREDPAQDGRGFDLVGLQADWLLGEHTYLLGQGAFACTNEAGAYATGFLGAGWQSAASSHRLVVELRAGAGGGAGMKTGGGALVQPMVGWLWEGRGPWGLQFLGGQVRSLKGGFRSPVLEAGLVYRGGSLRER